jgi:hypothetical protein
MGPEVVCEAVDVDRPLVRGAEGDAQPDLGLKVGHLGRVAGIGREDQAIDLAHPGAALDRRQLGELDSHLAGRQVGLEPAEVVPVDVPRRLPWRAQVQRRRAKRPVGLTECDAERAAAVLAGAHDRMAHPHDVSAGLGDLSMRDGLALAARSAPEVLEAAVGRISAGLLAHDPTLAVAPEVLGLDYQRRRVSGRTRNAYGERDRSRDPQHGSFR